MTGEKTNLKMWRWCALGFGLLIALGIGYFCGSLSRTDRYTFLTNSHKVDILSYPRIYRLDKKTGDILIVAEKRGEMEPTYSTFNP
ncbi:MAG: hypothetical protein HN909_00830 [Phycisphaerales bacterium]|jgi:hypothetical protein|nr:hypothetical protein [Phycisphaerales bacterium]MBT7170294.1 hypothetical protein [Phycisphaerales bacterium]